MKPFEDTISEFKTLWKPKTFVSCPYCESCILPGYMNVVNHYMECQKNPNLLKAMEYKTPLIDEIKKNIKF